MISPILRDCVIYAFRTCEFLDSLKLAEIVPIPKVNGSQNPGTRPGDRPISILSSLSKLYERVISNQVFKTSLSRACNNSVPQQHQTKSQRWETCRCSFMDLSRAFDTTSHSQSASFKAISLWYAWTRATLIHKFFQRVEIRLET